MGLSSLNSFTISKCLSGQSMSYFSKLDHDKSNCLFTTILYCFHIWTHILPFQIQNTESFLDISYLVYFIPHLNSLPAKTPMHSTGYCCYLHLEVFHGISLPPLPCTDKIGPYHCVLTTFSFPLPHL